VRRTRDGDGGAAGATEGLDGEDLVVVVAGLEAVLLPDGEVVGGRDSAGGALAGADGEELAEGRGADDGGLVDLGVRADLIAGPVAGQGRNLGAAVAARVVGEVLDNVVLCDGG
jgi:hypothetical protein